MKAVADRFLKRIEHIPHHLMSDLSKIDELKGRWIEGAKLHPQILGNLKQSVLLTSTGSSTRIEGSRMSDEDIDKFMRGISIQKFRDRDMQEVKGYYELLENAFNSWKRISFGEACVKHFHKELLKYSEKDKLHRGDYKHTENKVHLVNEKGESIGILFDTAPAYLTPSMMQELVECTKHAFGQKIHPLLIIGNFLIEFLSIHPFSDGNGRISRILTNLLALQHGYAYMPYVSHEKLIEDNKSDYYLALRTSQKTFKAENPDVIPWLSFFLAMIRKQAELAIDLLSTQTVETVLSIKQLAVWRFLDTVDEATPLTISQKAQVGRSTVNQALDKLIRLGRVERIGAGSSTRYRKRN